MNENEEPGSKRNKEIINMTNQSKKIENNNIIPLESRIMTRTTRYRINEKIAIDKKSKHVIMSQYKLRWKKVII